MMPLFVVVVVVVVFTAVHLAPSLWFIVVSKDKAVHAVEKVKDADE